MATTETTSYLKAKILFEGTITCLTGLHIGGVESGIDVGGIDKYVIRNPLNNSPYIPGSSLKGKIRALIEYAYASHDLLKKASEGRIATVVQQESVKNLFGMAIIGNNQDKTQAQEQGLQGKPSKVLFRDAVMSAAEIKRLEGLFSNGLKFTERKAENTLKRLTAAATPRQIERVPAGTVFDFSMVVNVDEENLSTIIEQLEMLETGYKLLEMDGLGGMVSRGYGQVRIEWMTAPKPKKEDSNDTNKTSATTKDDAKPVPGISIHLIDKGIASEAHTFSTFESLLVRARELAKVGWSKTNGS